MRELTNAMPKPMLKVQGKPILEHILSLGIIVALIGGKGYEWADDVAALLASFIIAWNGLRILRPAIDELMDAAAPEELRQHISSVAATVHDVDCVQKCVVRQHEIGRASCRERV